MKMKPLGWAQFHITGVLIKRVNLDTRTHRVKIPCEDEGRYWGHASTSQRIPRLVNKSPRAKQEAWDRFPLRGFRKEAPLMTP